MIEKLDMKNVKAHYDVRVNAHQRLLQFLNKNNIDEYINLALAIDEPEGNYSAHEHGLGSQILSNNNTLSIINLAKSFIDEHKSQSEILKAIYSANLKFLKISVGTEMAMLLKPNVFWVANVRTVWTYLLFKHNLDLSRANEELKLYRSQETTSEMEYKKWRAICVLMKQPIENVCVKGNEVASAQGIEIGDLHYMWFDAIANSLYENFATS